tara:strand:- start:1448 stop:1666 length:219 start_codon:yes stop_codon:yes gene_type:complete
MPQNAAVRLENSDRYILNTDGINIGIWDRRLEKLVRDPPQRFVDMTYAKQLVTNFMEESGRDNLTALIVSIS